MGTEFTRGVPQNTLSQKIGVSLSFLLKCYHRLYGMPIYVSAGLLIFLVAGPGAST